MTPKIYPLLVSLAVLLAALGNPGAADVFTSSRDGNWNDGATWGSPHSPGVEGIDFPSSSGGDYVNLSGGDEVTIPSRYRATAGGEMALGTSGNHGKLIIDGSLTLDGDFTMHSYSELQLNPGSTLDLNGRDLILRADGASYYWLRFNGVSGSEVTVTSTTPGGRIYWVGAGWAYTDTNIDYVDFTDLGVMRLGRNIKASDPAQNFYLRHSTFTRCSYLELPSHSGGAADIVIEMTDFRDCADDRYCLKMLNTHQGPITGRRELSHCTFSSGGRKLQVGIANLIIDHCILNHTILESSPQPFTMTNSFLRDPEHMLVAGCRFEGNYFYSDVGNPHSFHSYGGVSADPILIRGNTLESTYTGTRDDGDHFIPRGDADLNLVQNLLIEAKSGVFFNGAPTPTGTMNLLRNTIYSAGTIYGMFIRNEGVGYVAGTLNARNNLIVDRDSSPARGVNFETDTRPDQLDYTDYNNWHNVDDHYFEVYMSTRSEGDPGFGGNDLTLDPRFIDPSRCLATYDAHLGGPGIADHFIGELMKLNQDDYNPAYTVTGLIAWVREGFTPTNQDLIGAGDPMDGSPDIGAMNIPFTLPPHIETLQVFYNGKFANAADPNKEFLAVGQVSQMSVVGTDLHGNVTNYAQGITGIRVMFDQVVTFSGGVAAAFSYEATPEQSSDKTFTPFTPPRPATYVVDNTTGKTVVTITFADGEIKNRWLKTIIDASQIFGNGLPLDGELPGPLTLPSGDGTAGGNAEFIIGNRIGDVDGSYRCVLNDVLLVRNNVSGGLVGISNAYDIDKSGRALLSDMLFTRNAVSGTALPALP